MMTTGAVQDVLLSRISVFGVGWRCGQRQKGGAGTDRRVSLVVSVCVIEAKIVQVAFVYYDDHG